MANIDSLKTIIEKPKKEKFDKKGTKTSESESQKSRTSLSDKQWDFIKYVLGAIILALFVGFAGVFVSYLQVVHDSYLEFTKTLQEYNNSKYEKLDIRVKQLENQFVATQSAK